MTKAKTARVRTSIALPTELYETLKTEAASRGTSVSSLIYSPIASQFSGSKYEPLPEPMVSESGTTVASFFCEPELYRAAVHECERQHGKDGARSVAGRVLAALIQESLRGK